jgi:eukaryotic-like serine/threonine-protein kinase
MGHKLQNRYDLQGELGSGGMGTVYRGMDTQTEKLVAVKLLRPEAVADDSNLIERFAREADALRQLDHPNIVKVLDTFEEDGRRYIVLEYVAGGSLRDLLESSGLLSIRQTLDISLDLADALTRAHRLKIIHRDLKPANVLVLTIAPSG